MAMIRSGLSRSIPATTDGSRNIQFSFVYEKHGRVGDRHYLVRGFMWIERLAVQRLREGSYERLPLI